RIWMETKKLLAAPDPMPGLQAMEQSGVFAQLFPEAKGLDLVRRVVALEAREKFAPDPMLRFLSLFWKEAAAVRKVASRLKLSNDERQRLSWSSQDETAISVNMPPAGMRRALYAIGHQVFSDRVLLQWAQEDTVNWSSLYTAAMVWQRPAMPVAGEDLLARNVPEGPAIGAALRKMEEAWIASDFTLDREALLRLL
ncbi:MAG TPA: CCA tRNA nucleotidyltransferase, partial [Hyphomonadaceae bacterium]|nr:CCA tRNA nucleotidyltransferase [Hyphomonadaceae bacterium]